VGRQFAVHLGHARAADLCDETKRCYANDLSERGAALLGSVVGRAALEFGEDRIFRVTKCADDERKSEIGSIPRIVRGEPGRFLSSQAIETGARLLSR